MRAIFDAHATDVWRALHFLGVADSDVADVCQEVFLTVHRRLDSFEGRSSLRSWIYGVCVRTASAYRRKAYRRRELAYADVPEDSDHTEQLPEQENALLGEERADLLRRLVGALDEKQRAVFVLYELQEMPMKEIAATLELPLQTAYSRLKAARKAVRLGFERVHGSPFTPHRGVADVR